MVVSQHLTVDGSPFSNPTLYQSLVGALQYLTITRPDIAHAVNSVSQFLHAPTIDHFLAVKRILRYVKGTLHFGLTFRPSTIPSALVAYSDADWAGCPDTRRSTSGYSIYLGNNLVSWSAKKQPNVSRSSYESEYRALAMIAAELLWLTHLLHDLKRSKHVELDYHFLRELVVAGKLRTQYVPSHLQVADIFTKSVSRPLFEFFRSKLHIRSNPTLSLQGGVKDT
ncbi:Retrovirus-related Pol polyprotein from transposon RE1 [Vitis vinifera]|uniref:Retrovirus-related Pol polyprotein from transposon RE1 n=1 Tax=Vitis vinifera TaxID=29760 RepID=A0A438GUV1_VITVI|nr:Retrovirus-related Pol polyprotein from transposon RE1 [Vitis vinifera]